MTCVSSGFGCYKAKGLEGAAGVYTVVRMQETRVSKGVTGLYLGFGLMGFNRVLYGVRRVVDLGLLGCIELFRLLSL